MDSDRSDQHPDYDSAYTDYQSKRSTLRKRVRKLYLRKASSFMIGPTLDFGCGIGELLAMLPPGSMGLEYNRDTVDYCSRRGLDVRWYDGFADNWALGAVPDGHSFQSLVLSHVLEHFAEPENVLPPLLSAASGLGVTRALLIVPGPAGYRSDSTHMTYLDSDGLREIVGLCDQWQVSSVGHFPLDVAWPGRFFPHHELQMLIERCDA